MSKKSPLTRNLAEIQTIPLNWGVYERFGQGLVSEWVEFEAKSEIICLNVGVYETIGERLASKWVEFEANTETFGQAFALKFTRI